MVLSYLEVARLVRDAGFPNGVPQATAVAIICAESGRDTEAVHVNSGGDAPGSKDVGLWQINDRFHPEVDALDPVAATAYALKLSRGGKKFTPWMAYTNGSYSRFYQAAVVAVAAIGEIKGLELRNRTLRDSLTDCETVMSMQVGQIKEQLAEISRLKADVAEWQAYTSDLHTEKQALSDRIAAALAALTPPPSTSPSP
jgi:hypothetical protein